MSTDARGLKILLGALILVVLIGTLLGGTLTGLGMVGSGLMGTGMMWGYGNPGAPGTAGSWIGGLTMAFGMLMMVAFWAALIVGAILLVRWTVSQPRGVSGTTAPEEPIDILRRRYAAGEIDQATYQQMKAELDGDSTPRLREPVGVDGARR